MFIILFKGPVIGVLILGLKISCLIIRISTTIGPKMWLRDRTLDIDCTQHQSTGLQSVIKIIDATNDPRKTRQFSLPM